MPAKPSFDADAVRRLVRQRVAESSLRAVADEVGISRGGLESFLKGRNPYTKTRLRLAAWRLRSQHPDGPIAAAEVDAAIALLGRYIELGGTEAMRARRVREVTARIESGT